MSKLEDQFERQLNDPGITCTTDLREQAAPKSRALKSIVVGVVQNIEGFGAKLQTHALGEICILV